MTKEEKIAMHHDMKLYCIEQSPNRDEMINLSEKEMKEVLEVSFAKSKKEYYSEGIFLRMFNKDEEVFDPDVVKTSKEDQENYERAMKDLWGNDDTNMKKNLNKD